MEDINVKTETLTSIATQVNAIYNDITSQIESLSGLKTTIEGCWKASEAEKCTAQLDKINAKLATFDETYSAFMSSLEMINAFYETSHNDLKNAILSISSGGGN